MEIWLTMRIDFGMHVVHKTPTTTWWGGYGEDQYVYVAERGDEDKFLGGVYTVESEADLEKYVILRLPVLIHLHQTSSKLDETKR